MLRMVEVEQQVNFDSARVAINTIGGLVLVAEPNGLLGLPGGGLSQGELNNEMHERCRGRAGIGIAQAAVREAFEEISVCVQLDYLVGVYRKPNEKGRPLAHEYIFAASIKKGIPRAQGEHPRIQIATIQEIAALKASKGLRYSRVLRQARDFLGGAHAEFSNFR